MSTGLAALQIGPLLFLGVMLLITFFNMRRLRRLADYPASDRQPMISVCVPARNEEGSLNACIESLAVQNYPSYEVLVLDDGSTDRTPAIIQDLELRYPQVKGIGGKPLPEGWLGKHWGCHQLAQIAVGDLLLFTDADTRHHPDTLRSAAAALAKENADLLAGLPKHEVKTWAEKLLIPIISWCILSLLPLDIAYRVKLPALSAAIGQFMLFRRAAYDQIGGHSAVRSSIVDDLALARRIKMFGLRWRMVDATRHVTCRMYHNREEVIDGLSKNLFAVFDQNPVVHLFVWLWLLIVFWSPLAVWIASAAGVSIPSLSLWLAGIGFVWSIILWGVIYQRLNLPLSLSPLYPVTILGAFIVALRSMVITRRGTAVWKGRTIKNTRIIPEPQGEEGLQALSAMWRQRSILAALSTFHHLLGDIFQIKAGAFQPVIMAGPDACRFVLVTGKDHLSWRPEGDPVTKLLREGLLVQDGECHDWLRHAMQMPLHRRMLNHYVEVMVRRTDDVTARWGDSSELNVLNEMRRAALLILMETLFDVDFTPHLDAMLPPILQILAYISPGAWIIWPEIPRWKHTASIQKMDAYLYEIIRKRRKQSQGKTDLLSLLVQNPDFSDALIRDQLLTMLIAGHDTSTALLSWVLYVLGQHPDVLARTRSEVDRVVGSSAPNHEHLAGLVYLDQVIRETLRLYPPIHMGNRIAKETIVYREHSIPKGTRVAYSIYLTHRDPSHWQNPEAFDPERFSVPQARQINPYTYLPFGGGARNCIGMAFAQVEAKIVLARLIQTFDFEPMPGEINMHMGATLEPRPGVPMRVHRRSRS